MNHDITPRHEFNGQALDYDRARPSTPEPILEKLVALTGITPNSKLLEVGPATGQATKSLAARGYDITAVELGPELADLARHNLSHFPKVKVITGAFEDVPLSPASFDLVYSSIALHWVRPEMRYAKPHALLKTGGKLAIIHFYTVTDGAGDEYHKAEHPIYRKYFPGTPAEPGRKTRVSEIGTTYTKDFDSKLFRQTHFEVFPIVTKYTAEEYARLYGTWSWSASMPPDQRAGFFADMVELINTKYNGFVSYHHAYSLVVAEKMG